MLRARRLRLDGGVAPVKAFDALLVEVTRGGRVESEHRIDAVIADASGAVIAAYGEGARPVFPRSSIKALQALPFVESGALEAFGLEQRHVALACASHWAEAMHLAGVGEMLAAAGLGPHCLECGPQLPTLKSDQDRLVLSGRPAAPIHNCCSGKHAAFLCFAVREGFATAGYVGPDHPVQRAVADALTGMTGARHDAGNRGVDGCAIPTYAIPLGNLAVAFARFGVGVNEGPQRSRALVRIRDACIAFPELTAGTGAFGARLMRATQGRVFAKDGAEGMFVGAIPALGAGFALKVRDGAGRAAEIAAARIVESLLELEETQAKALKGLAEAPVQNRSGVAVGSVRLADQPVLAPIS